MGTGDPAKRAILIAGPTASGKSALALSVAEEIGGTIINADSMQVYADLRVLTARPPDTDMARVPHRLFGHVDAAEGYSVGRWLREVEGAIDEAGRLGRVPILVGGTGLYLKALMEGLSAIPPVLDVVRTRLREEGGRLGAGALHARLRAVDPVMAARLRPTDPQRILRALEVFEATGRSLAAWQADREAALLPLDQIEAVILEVPRRALNERIGQRFAAMVSEGALAEAEALASRNLSPDLPAMRALGVAPLIAASRGQLTLDAAITQAITATRRYAKRQNTFARHQLPIAWRGADEAFALLRAAFSTRRAA